MLIIRLISNVSVSPFVLLVFFSCFDSASLFLTGTVPLGFQASFSGRMYLKYIFDEFFGNVTHACNVFRSHSTPHNPHPFPTPCTFFLL